MKCFVFWRDVAANAVWGAAFVKNVDMVDFVGVVIFCGKKEDGQDGVAPIFLEQPGQANRCRRFVCDESWTSGENGLLPGENEEGVFGKGAPTT